MDIHTFFNKLRDGIAVCDAPEHVDLPKARQCSITDFFKQLRYNIENDILCSKPTTIYVEQPNVHDDMTTAEVHTNENDNKEESIAKVNPLLMYKTYFDKAIEKGYMEALPDGKYNWIGNDVDLAYFIGALYCGDTVEENTNYTVWKKGKKRFPAKNVEDLFGKNVAQLRINRTSQKAQISSPPQSYFGINNLIKEVKESIEGIKENEPKE